MRTETLEKAIQLKKAITECDALLGGESDSYYWCKVSVRCANCTPSPEREATLPRPVFNKMLDALREEREKLQSKLESL